MHDTNPSRICALSSPSFLIAIVLIFSIVAASTNGTSNQFALAQNTQKSFTTTLSDRSEVPPLETNASGTAQFQLSAVVGS
jgi:hypothetical protein